MTFDEYQKQARTTDVFADNPPKSLLDAGYVAKVLGLTGEAGEIAEKYKKVIRDGRTDLNDQERGELIKELGDVLWYVAILAEYLGSDLGTVAEKNLAKLEDRHQRGVISSAGDNR